MKLRTLFLSILASAAASTAQTTRPTTRPSSQSEGAMKNMTADQIFEQMLKPTTNPARPLPPAPQQERAVDSSSVKPNPPSTNLLREGTFIIDRLGRLTKTDKGQWELTFESDGSALRDPPMLLLPNLKLAQLEEIVNTQNRDLKVRVTGKVTEYRGRNYLLLDMLVIPPDATQQF